jgi:hypothetical protein
MEQVHTSYDQPTPLRPPSRRGRPFLLFIFIRCRIANYPLCYNCSHSPASANAHQDVSSDVLPSKIDSIIFSVERQVYHWPAFISPPQPSPQPRKSEGKYGQSSASHVLHPSVSSLGKRSKHRSDGRCGCIWSAIHHNLFPNPWTSSPSYHSISRLIWANSIPRFPILPAPTKNGTPPAKADSSRSRCHPYLDSSIPPPQSRNTYKVQLVYISDYYQIYSLSVTCRLLELT